MTDAEALDVAKSKWGDKAYAKHSRQTSWDWYTVGVDGGPMYGQGKSWEDAFAEAAAWGH
jgi:hypothetical protein